MRILATLLLALAPAGLPSDPAQDAAAAEAAYAPERPPTLVRYWSFKGEVDPDELRAELDELDCELLDGPRSAKSRPDRFFVTIAMPTTLDERAARKTIKQAGLKAEPLEWFAFEGRDDRGTTLPSFGDGLEQDDHILGMSGDIRWFDSRGGLTQFYCVPKKMEASDLQERWEKLFGGFGGGTLGTPVREGLAWRLAPAADDKLAKKLTKAIAKLDGVDRVLFDETGSVLTVSFVLVNLSASGPPRPFPGEALGRGPLRGSAPTVELQELLAEAGLTPSAP